MEGMDAEERECEFVAVRMGICVEKLSADSAR